MSAPILIEIRLPDDQLERLAALIAERLGRKSDRPLTVPQAAARLGLAESTIRDHANAGIIKAMPRPTKRSRMLIPAAEIERLLNPQPQA